MSRTGGENDRFEFIEDIPLLIQRPQQASFIQIEQLLSSTYDLPFLPLQSIHITRALFHVMASVETDAYSVTLSDEYNEACERLREYADNLQDLFEEINISINPAISDPPLQKWQYELDKIFSSLCSERLGGAKVKDSEHMLLDLRCIDWRQNSPLTTESSHTSQVAYRIRPHNELGSGNIFGPVKVTREHSLKDQPFDDVSSTKDKEGRLGSSLGKLPDDPTVYKPEDRSVSVEDAAIWASERNATSDKGRSSETQDPVSMELFGTMRPYGRKELIPSPYNKITLASSDSLAAASSHSPPSFLQGRRQSQLHTYGLPSSDSTAQPSSFLHNLVQDYILASDSVFPPHTISSSSFGSTSFFSSVPHSSISSQPEDIPSFEDLLDLTIGNSVTNIRAASSSSIPTFLHTWQTSKSDLPLEVELLGLPREWRVDTNIKVSMKLIEKNFTVNNVACEYTTLRLPMGARTRYLNISDSPNPQIIDVSTKVYCARDLTTPVIPCGLCCKRVRRARVQRTYPTFVVNDENVPILEFTGSTLVPISTGLAKLRFNINCYCSHHSEDEGFRIQFTLRHYLGEVIGQVMTDPILIVDTRKSKSKIPLGDNHSIKPTTPSTKADVDVAMGFVEGTSLFKSDELSSSVSLLPRSLTISPTFHPTIDIAKQNNSVPPLIKPLRGGSPQKRYTTLDKTNIHRLPTPPAIQPYNPSSSSSIIGPYRGSSQFTESTVWEKVESINDEWSELHNPKEDMLMIEDSDEEDMDDEEWEDNGNMTKIAESGFVPNVERRGRMPLRQQFATPKDNGSPNLREIETPSLSQQAEYRNPFTFKSASSRQSIAFPTQKLTPQQERLVAELQMARNTRNIGATGNIGSPLPKPATGW